MSASPFSIYVHLPYCEVKCPYCDFNSYAVTDWPESGYTRALGDELRLHARDLPWRGAAVATVFFGGGTPSLFHPASIASVLDTIAALWPLAAEPEISLEANPGSVERERLAELRRAGVNRLSLGIQSFQPGVLQTLGRVHDAADARAAITAARGAGFDNLSLDLIFAVPGQTRAMWEADLGEALAYAPEHLATYNLTYEPGTPFHARRARGALTPLGEDDELWMYQHARARAADRGYVQYEISNFARPGRAARHNRRYWQRQSYLGVGAGAHSFADTPAWGVRWSNERIPDRYLAAVARGRPATTREELARSDATREYLFLGLRELDGIDPAAFAARFGGAVEDLHPAVPALRADGLLEARRGRLALSGRGLLVADSVFAAL